MGRLDAEKVQAGGEGVAGQPAQGDPVGPLPWGVGPQDRTGQALWTSVLHLGHSEQVAAETVWFGCGRDVGSAEAKDSTPSRVPGAGSYPGAATTVGFFDVGETIIDETREYGTWADRLGVLRHTFAAVFGAVIARGGDHRETFQYFRPGFDLSVERERQAWRI